MIPASLLSRSDALAAGYRDVPPAVALDHLGVLRIVDVREPDEFLGPLGHLHGAELVPLSTLAGAATAWAPEAPILLVCRSGVRSARAAAQLAGMGFPNLFNLMGGMLAWEANAFPTSRHDGRPGAR